MNEEAAKAAIEKMQKQIDFLVAFDAKMKSDSWAQRNGVLITGNDAKALIELWNFYQMYKPK